MVGECDATWPDDKKKWTKLISNEKLCTSDNTIIAQIYVNSTEFHQYASTGQILNLSAIQHISYVREIGKLLFKHATHSCEIELIFFVFLAFVLSYYAFYVLYYVFVNEIPNSTLSFINGFSCRHAFTHTRTHMHCAHICLIFNL